MHIDFHQKLAEIQADPDGIAAIQYLQSRGLSGYLFPVPFRNQDIEDSPENILARDLSIGATLSERVSEHLYCMGKQNMQQPVEINDVVYQFFAQLMPVPSELLQETEAVIEHCPGEQAMS